MVQNQDIRGYRKIYSTHEQNKKQSWPSDRGSDGLEADGTQQGTRQCTLDSSNKKDYINMLTTKKNTTPMISSL